MKEEEIILLKQIHDLYSKLKDTTKFNNKPNGSIYSVDLNKFHEAVVKLHAEYNPDYLDEMAIDRLGHTIDKEGEMVCSISEKNDTKPSNSNYNKLSNAINKTNSHINRDLYSLLEKAKEVTEAE